MEYIPKILIADNEERNLRLMEAVLLPLGLEIIKARDGKEVLEKARQVLPDVVLMDVMMPQLDGFEATRQLKQDELTHTIPIVMVTALNGVEDRIKAFEAGADDFLSKPIDHTELQSRVRSLLKVKAYNDYMIDQQKHLEDIVSRRTVQLKKALELVESSSLEIINRLTRAAEYRDNDTASHIIRVGEYSAAIARILELPGKMVELIKQAAPMHDVGKIGISDTILLKSGKLDTEEWDVMKTHTTIGKSILHNSNIEYIQMAETIAYTHHEKWDGRGYPQGLIGSQIPLPGRIVAVADVFDAVTTRRPYRKEPFPMDQVFSLIQEGRASHFDPEVVDVFLSIKKQVITIMKCNEALV
ncbi:MAG: response regulator [Bacteroidetes bacterium]|nr:response regulator [Bacteroidota bacterium]